MKVKMKKTTKMTIRKEKHVVQKMNTLVQKTFVMHTGEKLANFLKIHLL